MKKYIIEIPTEKQKTEQVIADGLRRIAKGLEDKKPVGFNYSINFVEEETDYETKLTKQIKLVRDLQNKYFSTRSKFILNDVKKAERDLDKMMEEREKELKAPTLF